MNLDLSPADEAFRSEVRAFIATHLTDEMRAGQRQTTSMYPEPDISGPWQQALQARGWLVPLWPKEWGGTGWTPLHRFIFETECALAGAPLVHPMGVRLVGPVILRFGSDAQKRTYLPRILSGADYWCQGFSEPNAGSDLASLMLKATPDGDDYVLNGSKIWTTHAHHANWMFALVRTSHEGKRQQGISFLLIDMKSPGVTVRPIATIGGDHDVNEVHFQGVRVPQANRVGEENAGWECAKYLLEFERGAGIFSPRLRSQLKRVAEALSRAEGGAQHREGLVRRFGELASDLDTFEWLELRTMVGVRPGESPGPVSSILKLRASRLKQAIGELGVDALGAASLRWRGSAATDGDAQERLEELLVPEYCNSRAFTIFGGAAEIQLGLIAKTVVGV
jgi:acyl-CoA dehydrogenase